MQHMQRNWQRYLPAAILGVGCLGVALGSNRQRAIPLAAPLATLPSEFGRYHGTDQVIGTEEQRVAGMSSYLLRSFSSDGVPAFSVYVGYYDHQLQGKTIHSPKNCLPGAGWEAVASSTEMISTAAGPARVNRYLLVNEGQKALVYYWYQGRGRVEANEYRVKLQLLRDSALRGRTEEALVRVVVPVTGDERAATELAGWVSGRLLPEVSRVLPS
jgi:EpsI family protein